MRTPPKTALIANAMIVALALLPDALRAQDTSDSDPVVDVTVNGTRVSEVFRGMPLMITATFLHPGVLTGGAAPLLLSAGVPPWTNAVTLSVINSNDVPQTWPLQFAAGPDPVITLTETNYAELAWWFAPAQTPMLAPGIYRIQLTLNTTNATAPGAWKGVVESLPAEVTIADEPASLSEEQAINKFIQAAIFLGRQGNTTGALAQATLLLTQYPSNIAALTLKTSILQSMNRVTEARAASFDALVKLYTFNPNPPEPAGFLLNLNAELQSTSTAGPRLSILQTGAQFTLSWVGVPGTSYTLQYSTNLQTWSDLATSFNVNGNTFSWTTNLTGVQQFFRISF